MRKEDRGATQPTKVYMAYLIGGPLDGGYVKVEQAPHADVLPGFPIPDGAYHYQDTRGHTYRYQWRAA